MFGLAQPVSNMIGWFLPAYLSIQAIESPGTNDDKQWLTYWVGRMETLRLRSSFQVVFGLLNLVESMGVRAILYWVPMYYVFKTLFIIYRESWSNLFGNGVLISSHAPCHPWGRGPLLQRRPTGLWQRQGSRQLDLARRRHQPVPEGRLQLGRHDRPLEL